MTYQKFRFCLGLVAGIIIIALYIIFFGLNLFGLL